MELEEAKNCRSGQPLYENDCSPGADWGLGQVDGKHLQLQGGHGEVHHKNRFDYEDFKLLHLREEWSKSTVDLEGEDDLE